jgi:hypothetical protein
MTRRLISAATFATVLSACSAATSIAPSSPAAKADKAEQTGEEKQAKPTDEQIEAAAARLAQRRVGDRFVHRFSGRYRDEPLLLTEQVIGREGELLVIDYSLEEGEHSSQLRVRYDSVTGQVARVSRLVEDTEEDASIEDYEAMLSKTVFAPDYNEGRIARQHTTCLVADKEQDCVTTRYHVFVGDQPATLIVTQSEQLPGRDVSGTLKDAEGDILYHSELVEMQRGKPETGVAKREVTKEYVPREL